MRFVANWTNELCNSRKTIPVVEYFDFTLSKALQNSLNVRKFYIDQIFSGRNWNFYERGITDQNGNYLTNNENFHKILL